MTPAYLKIQELKQLADEVRSEISFIMSRKCQPSGPGRSVVDLTIAIHYVFNAPMDKILWDAGQHVRHLSVTVLNCQIPFLLKLSDIIFAQLSHLYFLAQQFSYNRHMHTRFSQEGALSFIPLNKKMAFPVSHLVLRASMIPLALDMDAIVFPLALVLPLCSLLSCMSNCIRICY